MALTTATQSYDESTNAGDATAITAAGMSRYGSNYRVPPDISVASFAQDATCAAAGSSYFVRRYPWKFYVLHTMAGEIGGANYPGGVFHQQAAKAVGAAIQNYAWYARRHGGGAAGGADVDNTTSYQCFKPHRLVQRSFRTWVDDYLDERIANSDGSIEQTQYKAGHYECTDSEFPQNGNMLSQRGAKARDETCGVTDWRDLDNYYYTGRVTAGSKPPTPRTTFASVSGGVRLDFPSLAGSSEVAWTYTVAKFVTDHWVTIDRERWRRNATKVPTSFTYRTSTAYIYKVRGCNPVGCSPWTYFNGGFAITPG